jgi:hypothetical protein
MGVESIIVPHISLFMGYIDSYEMLEKVFSCVSTCSKTIPPFMFNSTCMYLKGVSSSALQYLFSDSLKNDFLMQQKQTLYNLLNKMVYPNDWNMKDECSHITAGYYRNLTNTVRQLVNEYNSIPPCKISQVGVSLSGKRGVALSLLKSFDLL